MQCTANDSAYTCRQCLENAPGWRSPYNATPNINASQASPASTTLPVLSTPMSVGNPSCGEDSGITSGADTGADIGANRKTRAALATRAFAPREVDQKL